ncbi:MFS transporter [Micromonospora sp. WMMD1128]|uniref:MFS transporter n=1 Tax=Micromonospora sp. WMMD1128 TaxID=3015150 RepID=UPI00248C1EAD|nr:MFS transporter [Micromonospora sp. WMMD1128]WBB71217.1 MFS transporter [Micromonospora sp. WMMD1128]
MRENLGPDFGRLWSAYAVSTYGTWLAFGAFPLLAVQVLHSSAFAVSLLEAAGLAVAALVALPLGPWVEHRRKRPVMIAMDVVRFAAMVSVPVAYGLGLLSYGQLLVVAVVTGTAGIAFTAASGAYLKHLVRGDHLVVANGRFEGTSWVAIAAGPPLGGALVGLLGPVVTVTADAVSYLLSALAVRRIRGDDVAAPWAGGSRAAALAAGWRFIRYDPVLRRLFLNAALVGGLITATVPLLAVLLLGEYGFPAWQYGLAFGVPALGGFVGARLCPRLVRRYGPHRVLTGSGWLRSIFPLGLALVGPGLAGLLTVIVVEALLITCMGVFNPIHAAERLRRTPPDRVARVLSAWSVGSRLTQAASTLVWGVLATVIGPLAAIVVSGVCLLATPLLLPGAALMRSQSIGQTRVELPIRRVQRRSTGAPARMARGISATSSTRSSSRSRSSAGAGE